MRESLLGLAVGEFRLSRNRPNPFGPHTADPVPTLDLVVFRLTKGRFNLIEARKGLTGQSAQIFKMPQSIWNAWKPMNAIGSFTRARIVFDWDEGLGEKIDRVDVDRVDKVRGLSKHRL
jgi:hypothetical protein